MAGGPDAPDAGKMELEPGAVCEREVALNRRLAPDVYLGVGARVEPGGEAEPVVVMQRTPETARLSGMLARGLDVTEEITRIAQVLASFHSSAARGPRIDVHGSRDALFARRDASFDQTRPFAGAMLPQRSWPRSRRRSTTSSAAVRSCLPTGCGAVRSSADLRGIRMHPRPAAATRRPARRTAGLTWRWCIRTITPGCTAIPAVGHSHRQRPTAQYDRDLLPGSWLDDRWHVEPCLGGSPAGPA